MKLKDMSMPKHAKSGDQIDLNLTKEEIEATIGDQTLLDFIEECEEVSADMNRGVCQTRRATIFMRKEQSELVRQRADLSELLDLAQKDFEIAVRHTKNLI